MVVVSLVEVEGHLRDDTPVFLLPLLIPLISWHCEVGVYNRSPGEGPNIRLFEGAAYTDLSNDLADIVLGSGQHSKNPRHGPTCSRPKHCDLVAVTIKEADVGVHPLQGHSHVHQPIVTRRVGISRAEEPCR
ncbi:hypothetical protein E2C01_031593 [Portunus trituberculatus]|uniref:Uncharacterized protein n=1 Tax=Portunus trituberculatus TaxID=210409 RepID=A0A5B7EYZ9_PORTR|nr:hypothetical protein [Portunus trituberculatus]